MLITEIKLQKNNPNRYSVYVDGKYSFSASADDVFKHALKLNLELSESDIIKYKKISADSLLLSKTYDKCLRRPHSVKEIRDYLIKNKAEPDLIEVIIDKCLDKKLLNDQYFTERWYEHRKSSNKSVRYIKNELFRKGVSKSVIESVVVENDNNSLVAAIEKKRDRYDDENKLIAYLQRQGFDFYDIKQALDKEIN